ncbi:heme utilization cystosolic carrier protein HutX [Aestuariivirga sp.]|uniref:heme utilization cystosolic carrier protein HutX n=1 Tax=Aestuariivirga sp. TaxID=2650926 RepID=UPI0039E6E2FA
MPVVASERIDAAIAAKPDGVLEVMADTAGASLLQVMERLPDKSVKLLPAERFDAIWAVLQAWGEVLFIVHTPDIVLECTGRLPEGSHGHGYFNIHGDSPIGGHIKVANCKAIALVDRPFHGRRSCSVQFLNQDGNAMFKVFVRRDKDRSLLPQQLLAFESLWLDV